MPFTRLLLNREARLRRHPSIRPLVRGVVVIKLHQRSRDREADLTAELDPVPGHQGQLPSRRELPSRSRVVVRGNYHMILAPEELLKACGFRARRRRGISDFRGPVLEGMDRSLYRGRVRVRTRVQRSRVVWAGSRRLRWVAGQRRNLAHVHAVLATRVFRGGLHAGASGSLRRLGRLCEQRALLRCVSP